MNQGPFSFEILVNGRPLYEYNYRGEVLVEGRQGSEYTLRVRNNSTRRAVAVVSVDGLSVMTGKKASRSDSGYIMEPRGFVDIPGWRLNKSAVAHFFFGSLPEGYAAQMDQPDNIGVLGAAFYYEERPIPAPNDYTLESYTFGGPMRGGERSLGMSKGISTGFGRKTQFNTESVSFERESTVSAQIAIRYDDAAGLTARGIRLVSAHTSSDRIMNANPFPGDDGCVPPKDWRS